MMSRVILLVVLIAAIPCCFGFLIGRRETRSTGNCSYVYRNETGIISSPGYPNSNYINSLNCTYTILAPLGKALRLTFASFSLESGSSCPFDYLEMIDGNNRTKYCGNQGPQPFTSQSNNLVMKFVTDSSVTDKGFALNYRTVGAVGPQCNQELTTATGKVSSPGYPASYKNKLNCTTKITVATGKVIQLTFATFGVEGGSKCPYDYLKIIDGSNVKTYCGTSLPSQFTSQSNSIALKFKTDSSVTDKGYQASYKTVDRPVTQPPIPATINDANCGLSKVAQSRVIGGKNATKGSWPWQIGMFTSGDRFFCGGSLVSPQWVVTASHCVQGDTPGNINIKAGDWDLNHNDGTEQKVDVQKIIMHPKYNLNRKIGYDIALLKLKRPVLVNDFVNTVCIPDKDKPIAVGAKCSITGWGKVTHPGNSHPILQQAILPVVDTKVCQTKLDKMNWGMNITDQMVCGGTEGKIQSGCHGDSGGPYVCKDSATGKYALHGAVSWGSGRCSTQDTFTVFARVQALRQWIEDQLKAN